MRALRWQFLLLLPIREWGTPVTSTSTPVPETDCFYLQPPRDFRSLRPSVDDGDGDGDGRREREKKPGES